ncbi:MAG TPA: alanine--tRNA ligase, partial [Firmicutes bacterium]|nr:alanine--tRNA ligase [Bacillota bacterium]
GSLVEPDRLRFDFTHFSAMTPEELGRVNEMVNLWILDGWDVVTEELGIDEARKKGAQALFGEKYGDRVRVVEMGDGFSMELCGGTHVDNTAKVGVFHIDSEFSVASGVRRIEATTGLASLEVMNRNQELLFEAAAALKTKPGELRERAEHVAAELKEARRESDRLKDRVLSGDVERFLFAAKNIGGLHVITTTHTDLEPADMRKMGDFVRDKDPLAVAVIATVRDGKITMLAVCGKDAVAAGVKAGDLIKAIAPICGGKGGGKPDSAMGGGTEVLKLDDALSVVDNFVAEKLGK